MKKIVAFLKASWKQRPLAVLAVGGIALVGCFVVFGGGSDGDKKAISGQKISRPPMEGVKNAVDPRDVWVDGISREMQDLEDRMVGERTKESSDLKKSLEELVKQVETLKAQRDYAQKQQNHRESDIRVAQEVAPLLPPAPRRMAHLHQTLTSTKAKDLKNYVTSASQARAVLLTGVVAETGTQSASAPRPILLRLVDASIFSKWDKNFQVKDALLIGSCYGHISSERAFCRLESISLTNAKGEIVERAVEGWLMGEDGREGLRGDVVDKSSEVTRMAVLNGILGGVSSFFQNQATSSVFPVSAISGQSNALTGMSAMKAGAASGVGSALQKLADYAIKRAEQMNPVIVVDSGRVIDVVFRKGFTLKDAPLGDVQNQANPRVVHSVSGGAQFSGASGRDSREAGWQNATSEMKNLAMGRNMGEGDF